jgi:hypothetical protein
MMMVSKKSKKKKKSPQPTSDAPSIKEPTKSTRMNTPIPPVKNEKKALKKARAKEKKAANDELDQVLAELSIQCVDRLQRYASFEPFYRYPSSQKYRRPLPESNHYPTSYRCHYNT